MGIQRAAADAAGATARACASAGHANGGGATRAPRGTLHADTAAARRLAAAAAPVTEAVQHEPQACNCFVHLQHFFSCRLFFFYRQAIAGGYLNQNERAQLAQ
jgi:hypothetical protein